MLSGPAILRISLLLIVAGILAAVVQFLLPSPAPAPVAPSAPPQVAEPPSVVQPAAPTPAPAPAAGPGRGANAPPPTDAPPQIAAAPAPVQMPSDALAFPSDPGPAQGQEAAGQAEVERAEDSAGPRALAVVDLNTASVADLNRLRGGGAIGRAIVAKRPYASVDQLLTKRVLSRAVYERIKDQVTVR